MKTFKHFPKETTCPLCNLNTDTPCILIPIDGTEDGGIMEAAPVHTGCMNGENFRFNNNVGIIYGRVK